MIQNLLTKIITIIGAVIAIFSLGNFYNKKTQKIKQLEEDLNDATKSKQRQENRRNDDISAVKQRMQKYIRK